MALKVSTTVRLCNGDILPHRTVEYLSTALAFIHKDGHHLQEATTPSLSHNKFRTSHCLNISIQINKYGWTGQDRISPADDDIWS